MANKRLIGGATTKVAPGGGRGGEEESLLFATSDRLTVFGGQDGSVAIGFNHWKASLLF